MACVARVARVAGARSAERRGRYGAGGEHDDVSIGVGLRQEHHVTRRARQLHLVARLQVAEVVGADPLMNGRIGRERRAARGGERRAAERPRGRLTRRVGGGCSARGCVRGAHLLRRVKVLQLRAPVLCALHAERGGGAGHVVAVARRGDRVEADGVRLAILRVGARGNDAVRLALPVGHLALVVHDDVARLASGRRADDALDRDDLGGEGRLVLVGVDRDGRLVPVRVSLEEGLRARRLGDRRREGRPAESTHGQRCRMHGQKEKNIKMADGSRG